VSSAAVPEHKRSHDCEGGTQDCARHWLYQPPAICTLSSQVTLSYFSLLKPIHDVVIFNLLHDDLARYPTAPTHMKSR
jgi:hypothetical protein